jgi:D-xylose transport system substrate-binding protein
MRMNRTWALALAGALALAAAACVSPEQQGAGGGAGGGGAAGGGYQRKTVAAGQPVRIGFSMDTLKEERWQRDEQLVRARAAEVGAQIEVAVANGDDARQISQASDMLAKGVNVLIVAPHNGEVAASIVEQAHRQGVPVISYDRLIRNSEVDLYVSHQVEKIGELQAKYALDRVPKGNYVLIGGSPTDNNALLLRKGQENVLNPAVQRGDIKVISNQFAREWKAEEALRITEDALTKTGNDIQAIVASNDGTAAGAISALESAGVGGKVLVTGQDAEKVACQRIAAGKQAMTIYKPIKPLADSAVDSAVKLARGEALNAPDRINNGRVDVPSILHEPIAVDKENLAATVIKDGYHKLEEVYQGVPREQWPQVSQGGGRKAAGGYAVAALTLLLSAFLWVKAR